MAILHALVKEIMCAPFKHLVYGRGKTGINIPMPYVRRARGPRHVVHPTIDHGPTMIDGQVFDRHPSLQSPIFAVAASLVSAGALTVLATGILEPREPKDLPESSCADSPIQVLWNQ